MLHPSDVVAKGRARRGDEPDELLLGEHLATRLSGLMHALGQGRQLSNARRTVELLAGGWSDLPALHAPAWRSDITDDHSPFEFSIAFSADSVAARVLTEPQARSDPSLSASWRVATGIHRSLSQRGEVDLVTYDRIADLFAPSPSADARFCVWHGAALGATEGERFKIYLNPAVHGQQGASGTVAAALARLGLQDAWTALTRCGLRGSEVDRPIYFSLDLHDTPGARVKVYVAHSDATAEDLANTLSTAAGHDPCDVRRWCTDLLGGQGPFLARPPITCFAFRLESKELHSVTFHLPVRCYLPDDLTIARQVFRLLGAAQRDVYGRALRSLSRRPLDSASGLQTYVALRSSPGNEAVTVYLAPEVYSNPSAKLMRRQA